jgi:hypothetical protein
MLQTLHQVYQVSMELVLLNHVALELGRLVTPQKKRGEQIWTLYVDVYGGFMMIL